MACRRRACEELALELCSATSSLVTISRSTTTFLDTSVMVGAIPEIYGWARLA